jgi:hypothetical protein
MLEFFKMGGFAMFFILLFGGLTLAAAVVLMFRPSARLVAMIRAMSVSTAFVSLAGFAAGLAMVCTKVPQTPEWANDPLVGLIILTGVGESLTNVILGFSLLAIAWLVTAVGVRRMDTLPA